MALQTFLDWIIPHGERWRVKKGVLCLTKRTKRLLRPVPTDGLRDMAGERLGAVMGDASLTHPTALRGLHDRGLILPLAQE